MQHNYRQIENHLAQLLPFNGNSCHSFWDGDTYKVYSYSTLIASADGMTEQWVTPERYSVTTSRLQNLIKKAWGI